MQYWFMSTSKEATNPRTKSTVYTGGKVPRCRQHENANCLLAVCQHKHTTTITLQTYDATCVQRDNPPNTLIVTYIPATMKTLYWAALWACSSSLCQVLLHQFDSPSELVCPELSVVQSQSNVTMGYISPFRPSIALKPTIATHDAIFRHTPTCPYP